MPRRKIHSKEPLTAQAVMETPVGLVFLCFSAKGLQRLIIAGESEFREGVVMGYTPETQSLLPGVLKTWHDQVAQALDDYFSGQAADFAALALDLQGSPFHLQVWQELRKIPMYFPGQSVNCTQSTAPYSASFFLPSVCLMAFFSSFKAENPHQPAFGRGKGKDAVFIGFHHLGDEIVIGRGHLRVRHSSIPLPHRRLPRACP
jgi:hypothetical protein